MRVHELSAFEQARARHLSRRGKRLRIFKIPDEAVDTFENKAVVKNDPRTAKYMMRGRQENDWDVSKLNKETITVAIPIQSMNNEDWRDLFWLNIVELTIDGKRQKHELCGQCKDFTKCTLGGLMKKGDFKCMTQRKKLRFLTSRSSRRRNTSRRG